MSLIPFPNVPKLPGVPQLARSSQFPAGPGPVLSGAVALGRIALAFLAKPVWGVYKQQTTTGPVVNVGGTDTLNVPAPPVSPVVTPDTIRRFGYKQYYETSDYPVQDGSFASYNKVATPFETVVRMAKSGAGLQNVLTSNPLASGGGGSAQQARARFLAQLDSIIGTLILYEIRTPEKTYQNCNVLGYEIVRDGVEGAFFLTEVDLYFREIRQATAQYTSTAANTTNAKSSSAIPTVNVGTVLAQAISIL